MCRKLPLFAQKKKNWQVIRMYQDTIEGTPVIVYSLEEHAKAEVYKKLCLKTYQVLQDLSGDKKWNLQDLIENNQVGTRNMLLNYNSFSQYYARYYCS